jgi:hypothetical protein
VDENIATSIVENKTVAAFGVIKFHGARRHGFPYRSVPRAGRAMQLSYAVKDIRSSRAPSACAGLGLRREISQGLTKPIEVILTT